VAEQVAAMDHYRFNRHCHGGVRNG
jgi:hypothetical protein